ncbi:MAG: hypothetical protein FWB80_00805 [Defluviitaleaceae bacterium]|nr:hypothetical protein [Defluviitaleaceae bacterium]
MESKKRSNKNRNREIEQRNRQKRFVFTGILTCLIVLAVAGLAYAVWDITNRRTIMTLNGERIATTDFRFFHTMQQLPPGELAQESVLNDLTQTLLILDRAAQHGVGATAQELAEIQEQAAEMRAGGGLNFISERRTAELLSAWHHVFERLMDIYMADFTPDQEEYQTEMAMRMENIILNSTDVKIKYLYGADWFEMDDIRHELEHGADFEAFTGEGAEPISLLTFAETYDAWASPELNVIFELQQVDDFSTVFEINGMYFIVKVYDRVVDEETVAMFAEMESERFINDARAEAFFELTMEWVDNADRDVNLRAISRF